MVNMVCILKKNNAFVVAKTGSGSLPSGHLSDLVRRGRVDDLLSDWEEELWGAAYTDPGLHGEHRRDCQWDDDDKEEEEEEEEGSGR